MDGEYLEEIVFNALCRIAFYALRIPPVAQPAPKDLDWPLTQLCIAENVKISSAPIVQQITVFAQNAKTTIHF
jgi:hypothetical protein